MPSGDIRTIRDSLSDLVMHSYSLMADMSGFKEESHIDDRNQSDLYLTHIFGEKQDSQLNRSKVIILKALDDIRYDQSIEGLDDVIKKENINHLISNLKQDTVRFDDDMTEKEFGDYSKTVMKLYPLVDEICKSIAPLCTLTGLRLKGLFTSAITPMVNEFIKNEEDNPITFGFFDYDKFSQINNLASHDQGDVMIVAGVKYLQNNMQSILSRRSGDEFVAFFTGTYPGAVKSTLKSVKENFASTVFDSTKETMGRSYEAAFEEKHGSEFGISMGLSSTAIDGSNYNERLINYLSKKASTNTDILRELESGLKNDEPFYMVNKNLSGDVRPKLKEYILDHLHYESEKSMKMSKKTDEIEIFNPTLDLKDYEYVNKYKQ